MKLMRGVYVLVGILFFWTGSLAAELRLYAVNQNDGTVSVIDTTSNTVIETITVGSQPFFIATTPDGKQLYVPNSGDTTVSVIDVATSNVSTITVGSGLFSGPFYAAFTATKAYVTNFNDGTVSVINLADQTIVGLPITVGSQPSFIATTPDGSQVYVLNAPSVGAGSVSVIDVASDTVIDTVTVGNQPAFVAFTAAHAFVTNFGDDTVSVINLVDHTLNTTILGVANGPNFIAVSPDQSVAFVALSTAVAISGAKSVAVIDTTAFTVIQLYGGVGEAPSFLAFTPNGTEVYAPIFSINFFPFTRGHTILEMDVGTSNTTTITESGTGTGPLFPAITPDGSTVYVLNDPQLGNGSASVVDVASKTILTTIPIGPAPAWAVFATFSIGPSAPTSPAGKQVGNCFFDQTDLINVIQWNASSTGSPIQYNIYRDAALTDLAGIVPATHLKFKDHNRMQGQTYTYYIVAVDGSGGTSSAAVVTVLPLKKPC